MTLGTSMQAMIRISPPLTGQVLMSMLKTRLRRRTEIIAAQRGPQGEAQGCAESILPCLTTNLV